MCAAQWRRMGYEIPEWWKFKGASPEEMAMREVQLADQPRAIRESIPDWLDALGESELGDAWDEEIAALNQRAPVYLRVNTLKTTRGEAIKWLASHGVEATAVDVLPDALVLARGKSLPRAFQSQPSSMVTRCPPAEWPISEMRRASPPCAPMWRATQASERAICQAMSGTVTGCAAVPGHSA